MAWTAIKASVPNILVTEAYLRKELPNVLKEPQKDLRTFVRTWEHKPKIVRNVKRDVKGLRAFTGVYSNWSKGKKAKPEDILMFLTRGTSVRYATMTPNFIPKTKRRNINSGGGQGGLSFVDPTRPQNGIEPREIEEYLYEKYNGKIKKEMQRIIIKSVIRKGFGL